MLGEHEDQPVTLALKDTDRAKWKKKKLAKVASFVFDWEAMPQ